MKVDEWIAMIDGVEGLVNSLREALTATEVLERLTADFGNISGFYEDPFWDLIADGKADEAYAHLSDCICKNLKETTITTPNTTEEKQPSQEGE